MAPAAALAAGHGGDGLTMDPRLLFPWLALAFAIVTALRLLHTRQFDAMARTWALLALIFALVSAWLRMAA
jgi:predicted outer membrane lipoprotein